MSKKQVKVCICGHFGFGKSLLNGQTVKTKIVTTELDNLLGESNVLKYDTHGGKKKLLTLPLMLLSSLNRAKNVVILPAQNGLRIIAPLLVFFNKFLHRKLHYVVIGGWLPDFLSNRTRLAKTLRKFDYIYVETNAMKNAMTSLGFENVIVMNNCKQLNALTEDELVYTSAEPYKLCTFSRVMKEKGIEDAVSAVIRANKFFGKTKYTLDIFGQIDSEQTQWFSDLQKSFPDFISYGGLVPFDKSVDVVKHYYALLFPTYYDGEGFAGTLIDAMAAGVPVVASDWKYNSEIVRDNETGFVFPTHNVDKLTDILINTLSDVYKVNNMKTNCLNQSVSYLPSNVIKILIDKLVS